MTGGIGFSRAGMDSSRNNRNLLKDTQNRNFLQKGGYKGPKIEIEKADPKVLAKIREERKSAQKRRLIVLVCFLIFSAMVLIFLLMNV